MKHNWIRIKMGDACHMYQPQTIAKKQLIEGAPYSVYGANGIIGQYTEFNHEDSELILTCRGASCGNVHYTKPFSWINGNAMVLKPNNKDAINIDFLRLLLNQKHIVYNAISGSAQPQITRTSLLPITIPLPPLPEQRAIVSKLEQLFSELEDGVANLQKAQRQLKVYRQAVLKKAFEGELTREWRAQQTNLPTAEELLEQIQAERERYYEQQLAEWKQAVANWEADGKVGKKPRKPSFKNKNKVFTEECFDESQYFTTLPFGDVMAEGIQNGLYKNANYYGEGTPIVRIDNFYDGVLHPWTTMKRLELTSEEKNKYYLEEGDILINRVNSMSHLGKCCMVEKLDETAVYESNIMRIKVNGNITLPKYLVYFWLYAKSCGQ